MNEQPPFTSEPDAIPAIDAALSNYARDTILGIEFRAAVDRAFDDHRALFEAQRDGKPLSSAETERFSQLNDFIIAAKQVMDNYGDPETEK